MSNSAPAQGTFLVSAARTATVTGSEMNNKDYRGLRVVVDTTVFGSGSVTVKIDALDRTSGKWHTLLTGAAIVGVTTNVYTLHPGAPVTANISANAQLGSAWRIVATANNANTQTYSIGYELLP